MSESRCRLRRCWIVWKDGTPFSFSATISPSRTRWRSVCSAISATIVGYWRVASRPLREMTRTLSPLMKTMARTPSIFGSKYQSGESNGASVSVACIGSSDFGKAARLAPRASCGWTTSRCCARSGRRPALMSAIVRPEMIERSSSVTSRSVSTKRSLCLMKSHSLPVSPFAILTSVNEPLSLWPCR